MKAKVLFSLITVIILFACTSYEDIHGSYTVTRGKFQSDSLEITKTSAGKYTVSYVDKLSRGNKSITLEGTRTGNNLLIKMGTMPVTFRFSDNYKDFTFSYYGHTIECERKKQ